MKQHNGLWLQYKQDSYEPITNTRITGNTVVAHSDTEDNKVLEAKMTSTQHKMWQVVSDYFGYNI